MTVPYHRPLDYSAPIYPADARQDRVAMSLTGWQLRCNSQSFEALQNNLHHHTYTGSQSRNHGRVLASQTGWGGVGWDVLGGQRTNISRPRSPLFSGRLRARGYPRGRSISPINFEAKLNINPTRFAAQQFQFQRDIVLPSFFKVSNDLDGCGEEPISPCDNVLIGSTRLLSNFRPEIWPTRLQQYINGIGHIFSDIMQDAALEFSNGGDSTMVPASEIRARFWQVETYWEFTHENPLREMQRLCRIASRSPFDWSVRPFDQLSGAPEVANIANSPCLSLRHRQALVRIYAKTTKRIRFEVVYDRDAIRQRSGLDTQEISIGGASRALEYIASSAAVDLETVFQCLGNDRRPENASSVIELVAKVHERSPSTDVASNILQMLSSRGCITMVPNTEIGRVVTRLRRDGVLDCPQRCGTQTTYPLSPEYREASQRLT